MKKIYPEAHITWCTRKESAELFINNHYVDELLIFEENALIRLNQEKYDFIICLDNTKTSAATAALAKGKNKTGFILDERGYIRPTNKNAKLWLEMSAFDDTKRKNQKSYQQIIYDILNIKEDIDRPIFILSDQEKKFSWDFRKTHKSHNKIMLGLNTGSGSKWPTKSWPTKYWEKFIHLLDRNKYIILLLGGIGEKEKNDYLFNKCANIINTGNSNSIRRFASIINACDVVITGDTFALHIATALKKKLIVLFGPTSPSEIEVYNDGMKILADEVCFCCYKRICPQSPSCMERITPEMVLDKLNEIVKLI